MGDGSKLAVDIGQLRAHSAALRADTLEAVSALQQISSASITEGFAALGAVFDEVGAVGADMTAAWDDADAALRDRLAQTAERLADSADLYQGADTGNAHALAEDIQTRKSPL
ncbi:transducer protein htr22 [Segniliparus rotundus DSM 44985]|uniref:Transducer protein htr22 n=1 Tax=Segniliparus rotundus (strain ATCC BAA-972 / CDC 1076 / CIP 108378 / DSM 44985 / JCM 13578) TaxID=640132 RepID=D6ZA01_SEGRD|nr:hypothetical protein [Segniliparus rotundus]ADG98671.1 transducer protein htr22 [Segniliparus rotundus DSM 44985]